MPQKEVTTMRQDACILELVGKIVCSFVKAYHGCHTYFAALEVGCSLSYIVGPDANSLW